MKKQKIVATNQTLKNIVVQELRKYGLNADLNHIDTSKITNMSNIFFSVNFNGDISQWDVSKVKNMSYMFAHSKFNGDISQWDISNVKDTSYMFANSRFNNDISQWNLVNIKNVTNMFLCSMFNQNLPNFCFHNKKIKLDLGLNLECFDKFQSLIPMIEINKTTHFQQLKGLFNLSPFFNLSNLEFLKFFNFVNEQGLDINCTDYFNSCYPFFSCHIFKETKHDWIASHFLNLAFLNIKPHRTDDFFNNFDMFFHILKNKNTILDELEISEIDLLCQNHSSVLRKLDELLKVLNKTVPELPNAKFVIDEFFEMEKHFIQEKNQDYFNFLKNNSNQSFSDFYPYYSEKQKKDLLFSLSSFKEDFSKELTI